MRAEILLRLRDKYGEKVLAAPVAEGFNLAAWILPFFMVGAGALLIVAVVRRWSAGPAEVPGSTPELCEDDRRRPENELRRGDGDSPLFGVVESILPSVDSAEHYGLGPFRVPKMWSC